MAVASYEREGIRWAKNVFSFRLQNEWHRVINSCKFHNKLIIGNNLFDPGKKYVSWTITNTRFFLKYLQISILNNTYTVWNNLVCLISSTAWKSPVPSMNAWLDIIINISNIFPNIWKLTSWQQCWSKACWVPLSYKIKH